MTNEIILEASNMIASFEGCKLSSYKDPVGIWTIGYGNRYINGVPVKQNQKITKQEALELLEDTVSNLYNQIIKLLPELTDNQMVAILDFSYNIGFYAFQKSTLFQYLKSGDYNLASKEFSKWTYSKGIQLPGLVRRRNEELKVFLGE